MGGGRQIGGSRALLPGFPATLCNDAPAGPVIRGHPG
jgi:hypothetical protein